MFVTYYPGINDLKHYRLKDGKVEGYTAIVCHQNADKTLNLLVHLPDCTTFARHHVAITDTDTLLTEHCKLCFPPLLA